MKKICRNIDDKGALEGLPLYLIILVVIAGVGTAIIAGWMMSAQSTELGSIEVDDEELPEGTTATIQVTTYAENGDPLEGVTVSIEGCGAGSLEEPVKLTDENGETEFNMDEVDVTVPEGQSHGEIIITAEYTGEMSKTKTARILVTD
ncbi:MAG: hypothetical protein KGY76_00450 [Candidatus Thermoplasmatota archaeon]|nr:hypothetical protein [Candidatus Thermoplasmatota archaeon]